MGRGLFCGCMFPSHGHGESEGVPIRGGGGFPEQSPRSQRWLSQLCRPSPPHPNAPQSPWLLPAPQHPAQRHRGALNTSLRSSRDPQ